MRSKFAFYTSLIALFFGCLAILDLIVGEGAAGWFFTIGAIGYLMSIPSAIILELTAEKRE